MPRSLRLLNADLHCHSCRSDGTLAPAQLVERAVAGGVELFALTDHDELSGVAEAREAARDHRLPFVAGVEVSVTWGGETIHVVGLKVDADDPALLAGLAATRAGRDGRGREMAAQLEAAGLQGAYEGAMAFAGNPALLSRTHFARWLVERGVCGNVRDVFERFLVAGKPGYVEHRWAAMDQAVGWIRAAGGIAVLAHPGRYRLGEAALGELIAHFRRAGGEGIEVVCGSHGKDQYARFARIARELGLRASRGSDFHSPAESRTALGALPPLPEGLDPVWAGWPEAEALAA